MPFEQTDTEIKHRIKDPELFAPESFKTKEIGDGISLILGKLKSNPEGPMISQAIRFNKEKWDEEKAMTWIKDHEAKFINTMQEYENEICIEMRDMEEVEPDSVNEKMLDEGVMGKYGTVKQHKDEKLCSIHFQKDKMPMDKAKEWYKANMQKYGLPPIDPDNEEINRQIPIEDKPEESAAEKKPELHTIEGVEIFSTGTWNEEEVTDEHLQGMVKAFKENKNGLRPFLKLGHDENQKLLQEDGHPAAGWIDNLRVVGDKLVADFVDVPKNIYQLIKNKAYRSVSSEVFHNIKIGKKMYERMLAAVALLGADIPAVMNLKEILAQYKKNQGQVSFYAKNNIVKCYSLNEVDKMSKEQIDELAELRKYKQDHELELAKAKKELELKQNELFLNELTTKYKFPKSAHKFALELLGEEKKVYSFEGEKKEFSKREVLENIISLTSAVSKFNLEGQTQKDFNNTGKSEKEVIAEINKYASEHKVSIGEATKAVYKQLEKA